MTLIRYFVALATGVSLLGFGAACQVSPDIKPESTTAAADLSVWVPEGWSVPIKFDEDSLTFSVAWSNLGSAMAEDYSLVLMVDGDVVYQWDKPLLAPGSERIESVRLIDLSEPFRLVQGVHKLELLLDPDGAVPERNRDNNSFSLVKEFQLKLQLPDLRLGIPIDAGWDGPVVIGGSDLIYGRVDSSSERGYFLAFGVATHGAKRDQSSPQRYSFELNDYPINRRDFLGEIDSVPTSGVVQIHAVPLWKIMVGGPPLILGDQRFLITINETNSFIEADGQNNFLTGQVSLLPSRIRVFQEQTDNRAVNVHAVYAILDDSADEQWDINGTIESIVADIQTWLKERTNGRGIIWDQASGNLDITFIKLAETETDLAVLPNRWGLIAEELYRRGHNDPNKIYAVWLPHIGQDDPGTLICGVQTKYRSVVFAFSFFLRIPNGRNLCINQPVTMVHELFHAFGAVAPCATNYLSGPGLLGKGHVDDDPNDIFYVGDRFGIPLELDQGHDDYFGHDIPGCPDTEDSPYLQAVD